MYSLQQATGNYNSLSLAHGGAAGTTVSIGAGGDSQHGMYPGSKGKRVRHTLNYLMNSHA